MNKRLKSIFVVIVATIILIMLTLSARAYTFSKEEVIFNYSKLGIMPPADITKQVEGIQFKILDSTGRYYAKVVNYERSEFEVVGGYLKKALNAQNLYTAYVAKAQAEASPDFEAIKKKYGEEEEAAIKEYVNNCIKYPGDTGWVPLNSNGATTRSELGMGDFYMMWMMGIHGEEEYFTPVLYSLPGTFQVVTFNPDVKEEIIKININGTYPLGDYVSYNKGRTDEPTVWSSSDPQIAKVDQNGKVTGVSNGYAVITATNEGSLDATVIHVTGEVDEKQPETPKKENPSPSSGITVQKDGNDLIISQEKTQTKASNLPGTTQEAKAQDETVAKGTYPKTGKITIAVIFGALIIAAGYVIRQNFKMRDIK